MIPASCGRLHSLPIWSAYCQVVQRARGLWERHWGASQWLVKLQQGHLQVRLCVARRIKHDEGAIGALLVGLDRWDRLLTSLGSYLLQIKLVILGNFQAVGGLAYSVAPFTRRH